MTEFTIAMILAWWVAVYHMLIGGYLVFLSERRTPFIVITGVVKGSLGVGIYLVVRQPLWVGTYTPSLPEVILPITLLVMLAFSFIVTILIWLAFGLDTPQERITELAHCGTKWASRQRRRFGR